MEKKTDFFGKKLFNVTFIIMGITFAGLITFGLRVYTNQQKLLRSEALRYDSYLLADELRQSSDDLTRLVRTYVVTGDEKYKKYYHQILAIRDGLLPRPENYQNIYWDLLISTGKKPYPDSDVKKPLQDLMREAGFTEEEFAELGKAQANSDGLVNLETVAMNAIKGIVDDEAKKLMKPGEENNLRNFAIRILNNDQYHRYKADIMAPTNRFLELLSARTSRQVVRFSHIQNFLLTSIGIFLLVFLALIAALFVIEYWRIKKPLQEIPKVIEKTASGELFHKLHVKSNDEFGSMAKSFNTMVDRFRELIGGASEVADIAVENSANLASLSQETVGSMEEIRSTMEMMDNVFRDNAATLEETNASISEVAAGAHTTAASATEGAEASSRAMEATEQAVAKVEQVIKDINLVGDKSRESMESMTQLANSVGDITSFVSTITGIADQTNLLALNAAIEAARAGEAGRGFAVVAEEVRKLAEESNQAAQKVGEIIDNLQNQSNTAISITEEGTSLMAATVKEAGEAQKNLQDDLEAVSSVNEVMQNVAAVSQEQAAASSEMAEAIKKVTESVQSLLESVAGVTAATDESAQAAETIATDSQTMAGNAQRLQTIMEKFSL